MKIPFLKTILVIVIFALSTQSFTISPEQLKAIQAELDKKGTGEMAIEKDGRLLIVPASSTKPNPNIQPPRGMEVKAVYTAKLELPKVTDSNYRTKIIDEELAKVKIPTEETDHLLALETEQEKMRQESKKKSTTPDNTLTNIMVSNQSKFAVGCAITALHTTSEKTSLFSRKYKKYITQTAVSEMTIVKPKSSKIINLNTAGIKIASDETIITLMVDGMQVTSKKHIKTETEKKDGVFYTKVDEAILVTDVTTTSWINNGKKKILLNQPTSLEFPTDFSEALSSVESHEGMNYYNLIAYMRACERIYEYAAEQVQFPPSYFDPEYISKLAPKELENVYQFIMKQFNRKFIPMPVGLTGLINCGKYNFVAKGLTQIALSIVMLFLPGAQASIASDVASIIESIVDNSVAIGQGVEALNAKNKKI